MSVWGENPDQSPMLNPDGSETVNPGTASVEGTKYGDTASASVLMTALVQDGLSLTDTGRDLSDVFGTVLDGASFSSTPTFGTSTMATGMVTMTFSASKPQIGLMAAKPVITFTRRTTTESGETITWQAQPVTWQGEEPTW